MYNERTQNGYLLFNTRQIASWGQLALGKLGIGIVTDNVSILCGASRLVDIVVLGNKYEVQVHLNCKCVYVAMRTKKAGTATNSGVEGADVYLVYFKRLPDYYISKKDAGRVGWIDWKGNLGDVAVEEMIGRDIYRNEDGKLPSKSGRIWCEADINYDGGYRNLQRALYSNDGLVFVAYDHYHTFYEITQ